MKTALKYLSALVLAIMALTWPLFRVSSTEGEGEADIREDVAAREAYRRMQLQDENGEIPSNGLIDAYKQKEGMPFLPAAWAEFMQGSGTGVVQGSKPGLLKNNQPGVLQSSEMDEEVPSIPNPWVPIGPGNIGGRIRSIIIKPPGPNELIAQRTIWVGAVSGGVWKTTDGGTNWSTTTDFLANLGVHCMAIDPEDPRILYAGTGEVFRGGGIFKTTDGGDTWQRLESTNHPDFYWVNRLAICPTNSQLLLAATSPDNYNGKIYRSMDGGVNWSLTQTPATPPGSLVNILDVRFQPHNGPVDPNVPGIQCIAGTVTNGAYYSTNGGATWSPAIGLPSGAGRVELAYCRDYPLIVYASVAINNGRLYRSEDGGHNFSYQPITANFSTGADGYHNSLWVDPTNPETVVVGGDYMWRSTDRGVHWAEASSTEIHADHHAIVEDPSYDGVNNKTVYSGNDGGIHQAVDILASSPPFPSVHWMSRNNGLAITQFYGAAGHAASGKIIGGTQDNGTLVSPESGSQIWRMILGNGIGKSIGGDGGYCAVDQTSDPYFYGEYIFLTIHRSINGGDTTQYIYNGIADASHCEPPPIGCYANATAPFILDPNDEFGETMLAGGRRLWRSTNVRGVSPSPPPSWFAIKGETQASGELRNINAIAVAPGNSNIIWVGHNDGSIYCTTNGMDADPTWVERDAGLPHGRGHMCTRITIGQADGGLPRKVYVTFSGFFPSQSDSRGNVWKTPDNGMTWTDISIGLPHAPIYSLVISPFNPGNLYIGTEVGVFASSDGGTMWSPGNGGPANVPVFELFWMIPPPSQMRPKLVAATHGRSIFTLTIPNP